MESKLSSLGIKTCGDLQCFSMSKLQKEFGPKTGQMLYRFCRGLDDRPVRREKERKSVSAEINYGIRFTQVRKPWFFRTIKPFPLNPKVSQRSGSTWLWPFEGNGGKQQMSWVT